MNEKGTCVKEDCIKKGKESITIAILHTGGSNCPEYGEPLKITKKSISSSKGHRSKKRPTGRS